jgi:hypothetical protein
MRRLTILLALLFAAMATPLGAHEVPARVTVRAWISPEPGILRVIVRVPLEAMRDIAFPLRGAEYLDLAAVGPLLDDAARLWVVGAAGLEQDGRPLEGRILATRISLPADGAFASYETALAHLGAPPLRDIDLPWRQALIDVLIEAPITSDAADFSITPGFAHLGLTTTTILHFRTPDGAVRVYQFTGDPGTVQLDPRWHHAALTFVRLGFDHILAGLDHLLFLLCLVLPLRRLAPLIGVVTSFTVAHSITLIASAFGFAPGGAWFPPLVETLIALSIVYMAFENIVGARVRSRGALAFGFGLVHGFGFSFALRESLQLAGGHLVTSLLAFNVGVELGQVAVLLIAVPALTLLFRRVVQERIGSILISALIAHSAWHWMTERGAALRAVPFDWPALDVALAAAAARALLLALVAAAALWGMNAAGRWITARRHARPAALEVER